MGYLKKNRQKKQVIVSENIGHCGMPGIFQKKRKFEDVMAMLSISNTVASSVIIYSSLISYMFLLCVFLVLFLFLF